ncbi:class I SAM-dependent DNA methyltransferase, partial [Flavobacterium sp. WLB]|uniref:HsdM family class I SAM-dependent methyltransferase n=1 Tax=Flavobacterium sp. WLB TaxID=2161662 RepID=UPI0013FDD0F0
IKDYNELKEIFNVSYKKYNSGLFDFIEDHFSLNINLKSEILIGIFNELYYPESPYNFAIIDPAILSQIYERYLGSKIIINGSTEILIVEEPEIAVSSGVVPTPKTMVQNIIRETLENLLTNKTSNDIKLLKIADICCGSGTFLISLYDYLIEKIVSAFIAEGINDDEIMYRTFDGTFHLTLKTKQEFLLENIYGVDVNPYAVEVTKFSLFLKLLENENEASLNNFLLKYNQKVLPVLDDNIKNGNSLIDEKYFDFNPMALDDNELLFKIRPFNWTNEFPFLSKNMGFDAIIGNPPYVRIQNMVKYMAEGIGYYKDKQFGYSVSKADSFDKYYLFIERAISLIKPTGIVGYIVPNKFFIARGGKALRLLLATNASVDKIIHFGVTQVFPNRSTYTAIIIIDKVPRENIKFIRIKNIQNELRAGNLNYIEYSKTFFSENPWIFLSKNTRTIFDRINNSNTIKLNKIANITVGLQTSKDEIYIFTVASQTETTFKFIKKGIEYEVEKDICKPCLLDLSFEEFDTVQPNAQMIFPYVLTSENAQVLDEIYFEKKYPLAWCYLNTFKVDLSKRSINGSKNPKWYQFGRSQSLMKFHNNEKLIWPVLSTHSNYIFDNNNLQFTGGGNGPYYSLICIEDYSPLYFLAILSHPLFEAMVKSGASEFRGSYYSHGKQFIENIPIKKINFSNPLDKKDHDDIVTVVKSIITTKNLYNNTHINSNKNILQRKLSLLQKKLYHAVNKIYDIDENDIKTVLTDEIFTTDLNEI